jgi:hypothetical protein
MTCVTQFAGIIIRRERDEECKWIDSLNILINGGSASCKEALQGLNLIRRYKKLTLSFIGMEYYTLADNVLAEAIREGRCEDW